GGLELQTLQLLDGCVPDALLELSGEPSKTPDDQHTKHASRRFEAALFSTFFTPLFSPLFSTLVPCRAEIHAVEAKGILPFTSRAGDFGIGREMIEGVLGEGHDGVVLREGVEVEARKKAGPPQKYVSPRRGRQCGEIGAGREL